MDGDCLAPDRIRRHSSGDLFSIRWDGWLRPPVSGKYVLAVDHVHSAQLQVDGKLVIDGATYSCNDARELIRVMPGGNSGVLDIHVKEWAVSPDGVVYAWNDVGQLCKRIPDRWVQIRKDVHQWTVGPNGDVYASNQERELFQLHQGTKWEKIAVEVREWAVDRQGNVYSLNDAKELARMRPGEKWERKATDVSAIPLSSAERCLPLPGNSKGGQVKSPSEVTLELKGPAHAIRLEYRNHGFAPRCRLLWEPPGSETPNPGRQPIPEKHLFPDRQALEAAEKK